MLCCPVVPFPPPAHWPQGQGGARLGATKGDFRVVWLSGAGPSLLQPAAQLIPQYLNSASLPVPDPLSAPSAWGGGQCPLAAVCIS